MLMFWIVSALLLAGALLFVLPPLWRPREAPAAAAVGANAAVYRDQLREAERDLAADLITPERFEQLRAEIQRRVLEDAGGAPAAMATTEPSRRLAVALGLLIPLASVAVYLSLGRPEAADPTVVRAAAAGADRHQVSGEEIERMVTALAERLKAEPDNAEGWLMLGRSYTALGRYRDAATALRKAGELLPRNADILADLADVTAMAQGKKLAGEPARLIQQVLDIDPRHVKGLALAGSVAFEARDYANARAYWERLLAAVPADSPMANSVRGSIAQATQLEGGGAPAAAQAAPRASAAATAQAAAPGSVRLTGEVSLSPELAAQVKPGDTVFVFARAAQGPRMPLAILRQPVAGWPLKFALDDSTAMSPELRLSSHPQVTVGVRISRSGSATPQSGDLVGSTGPLPHASQGVRLVVDRVQP